MLLILQNCMTDNLYFPYMYEKWFRFGNLIPRSTLDSSNTRIYLGEINWPISNGYGSVEFNPDEYETLNQSLSPSGIRLPRDYKTKMLGNTNMFKGNELAASLVFDQVSDLISQAGRIANCHPHSLCYLLDFNESKRELILLPNLILFHKRFK